MTPAEKVRYLVREALAVQNACNLSAVLHGAARACSALRECMPWDDAARHCVMVLWADKVASLVGVQTLGDERVMRAYEEAYALLGGAAAVTGGAA